MDSHNKRVLTDDLHASNAASNAPVMPPSNGPDYSAQLRSVSARIRKNVTEGYNTNRFNRTHGPSRTQSAGNVIFQSSNDTLLDVFSSSSSVPASTVTFTRKRRIEDELAGGAESDPEPVDHTLVPPHIGRPIKPLRKSAFSKSQSSPAAFGPGNTVTTQQTPLSTATEDVEEDWSGEMGTIKDRAEPMLF